MKRMLTGIVATLVAACAGMTSIDDRDLGLAKGSVFDTASPAPFAFVGPGEARLRAAPLGTPPVITHPVDEVPPPISATANACADCHAQPQAIGRRGAGIPTAMPADHYVKSASGALAANGTYYNCLLCHAPQSGAKPLVAERETR